MGGRTVEARGAVGSLARVMRAALACKSTVEGLFATFDSNEHQMNKQLLYRMGVMRLSVSGKYCTNN